MFLLLLYTSGTGSFGLCSDIRDHLDTVQPGYATCALYISHELGRSIKQARLDMEKRIGDFWSGIQCVSAQID